MMDDARFDALKLENQLCFPLYAAAREIVKRYRPFLDPIGLTYTQYIVMMVLWDRRCVTARELGERLYLDSGTLTPLLKKLESMDLVTRERSEADERQLVVTVTETGMALRERAADIPLQMAGCTGLTPEEGMELYRLLYRILEKSDM